MIYSNHNMKRICDRLVALSLTPSDAGNLCKQFSRWADNSGIEWSVNRMKLLKNFYIHWKFNNTPAKDLSKALPYFSKDTNGFPTGIFRRIMRHYKPNVVLKVLNFYSAFTLNKPSSQQLHKFYSSMEKSIYRTPWEFNSENIGRECRRVLSDYTRYASFRSINKFKYTINDRMRKHDGSLLNLKLDEQSKSLTLRVASAVVLSDHGRIRDLNNDNVSRSPLILDWISSGTRRAPLLQVPPFAGLGITSESESDTVAADHLQYVSFGHQYFPELLQEDTEFSICGESIEIKTAYQQALMYQIDPTDTEIPMDVVGKVSFIQENGCKLRAVANPFRVIQSLSFIPAFKLWSCLKELEQKGMGIHTYNQDKGLAKVQRFIQASDDTDEETKVFSIDLSDATNNFPWALQKELLTFFLDDECVSILTRISKGSWLCPDGKYRKFGTGQPLGAFFSFASFSIAHMAVALLAHRTVFPDDYCPGDRIAIVGDDIVLKGQSLNDAYRSLLERMDVPVSESKCISSYTTAEFLSKIVTRDKVYQVPKWKEVNAMNAFSLATVDPSCYVWMSPHIKEVVEWSLSLPEPLGIGRNPRGLSFEERIYGIEDQWFNAAVSEKKPYTLNPSAHAPTATHLAAAFYEYDQSCSCNDFMNDSRKVVRSSPNLDRKLAGSYFQYRFPHVCGMLRAGSITSTDLTQIRENELDNKVRGIVTDKQYRSICKTVDMILTEMYLPNGPSARGSHLSLLRRMFRKHKAAYSTA